MSESGQAQPIELLSVARGTDLDSPETRPVVILSIRPEPDRNWRFHHLSLTVAQAERLRDDLTNLLKASASFLLIAILALASGGCSAKVEVSNETIPASQAEADSAAAPPAAALEKHHTAVEIDFLGQQQPEPVVPKVANDQRAIRKGQVSMNTSGIQMNGDGNTIEFHIHRHRRSRSPVMVYPIVRHEMVIVPGDGSAPVVFKDNAPPRIALVDKEMASAYAAHMLRLAKQEGLR